MNAADYLDFIETLKSKRDRLRRECESMDCLISHIESALKSGCLGSEGIKWDYDSGKFVKVEVAKQIAP